jgi:adenosylcobinamide kinase/adenosylcobinamide-phosphate guanylyltransferase
VKRHRAVLVTGGARSGKSRFALERAASFGLPLVFVATGAAGDDEMAARIARHRSERGPEWRTIEEPRDLARVIGCEDGQAIVVDCVTLWISNLMGDSPDADVEPALDDLLSALRGRRSAVVLVTNEVGAGIVPGTPIARAYRDAVGVANQRIAAAADEVHLLVAGQPLRIK